MSVTTIARAIASAAEHYMSQRDAFDVANNLAGCDRADLLDVKVVTASIERRREVFGLECSNVVACAEDIVRAVHSLGGAP